MRAELAAKRSAPIPPQRFGSTPQCWPRLVLRRSRRLVACHSRGWFDPLGSKPRCWARWTLPSVAGLYPLAATGFSIPSSKPRIPGNGYSTPVHSNGGAVWMDTGGVCIMGRHVFASLGSAWSIDGCTVAISVPMSGLYCVLSGWVVDGRCVGVSS